ncbi:hypothetical protein BVG01_17990 [Bacillus anthracis]|nr:hypothetical protein BVG01_17990 [Bacillus anthracis]
MFRAWDIKRKEMIYIDDLYFFEEEGIHEIVDGIAKGHHAEYKIMQYTGLKDKNSKKIFEGDIAKLLDENHKENEIGQVIYREGAYRIFTNYQFEMNLSAFVSDEIEIVGNIYENSTK